MKYLVEFFRPRSDASLTGAAAAARAGAEEVAREGALARYLGTIFVPDDEICFHIYEAVSPGAAADAARRAGIAFERVLPVVTEEPSHDAGATH